MTEITATPAQRSHAMAYFRTKVLYQEEQLYDLSLVRETTEHGPVERWHAAIITPSGQLRAANIGAAYVAGNGRYRGASYEPYR